MSVIGGLKSIHSHQSFGLPNGYGKGIYGRSKYGDFNPIAGIYRNFVFNKKRYQIKTDFYPYVITNTESQEVIRTKFKNAMSAWQALSESEKAVYKKRCIGRHMSGHNLYISEFMKL